ncbi:MAG: hypothetical protein IH958_01095, partial [Chloroflexi bacterium]|nr:hypothetical protein [Chloroflexota bacterium]
PTFVMMTGDRTVTANFSSNCVTLTLNVGTGQGSIIYTPTSSGGCPANQYSPGTQVTLTASPAAGFAWVSWSGTDSNGTNPTFLIMTGDRTVTVNFQ